MAHPLRLFLQIPLSPILHQTNFFARPKSYSPAHHTTYNDGYGYEQIPCDQYSSNLTKYAFPFPLPPL